MACLFLVSFDCPFCLAFLLLPYLYVLKWIVFQNNYTNRALMKLALPVAVKFLHKGNRELSRNVTCYLPLAAIENSDLLAKHVQPLVDSVIQGLLVHRRE